MQEVVMSDAPPLEPIDEPLEAGMYTYEPQVTVEVNQRARVDKVLARYPEEFIVFRELLQNANDAGAKNFTIAFQSLHGFGSNGMKPDPNSAKVFKWLVKNDGVPFQDADWQRLTKIAEGNPDEPNIGFLSVFSVTDKPVVKSDGTMVSIYYDGNQLMVKREQNNCDRDNRTVIEMELKQESTIPRIFELTRFLVTSVTFLAHIQRVTILLDDIVLSCLTKTRNEASQSISIPEDMLRKSWGGNMSVETVELISQEVKVTFFDDALVEDRKTLITRAESEEGEPAPSLECCAQFSAKYSIYSANVTVSANPSLKKGLESAMKKNPPKDFPFEMVFFNKDEHDKHTREEDVNSGFGSVFCGPQGLCPRLEAEHPARIFIGQSTAQTTGMACYMSGPFISTMQRGLIDLANGHVSSNWNEELLYVGGSLARIAYVFEMNKVKDAWSTSQKTDPEQLTLALYAIKSFIFHPSTPDSKVSRMIQEAFFACSTTDKFPFISDQGIRHTKDIRLYHHHFAPFMRIPVVPTSLRHILVSMTLPELLRVGTYTFKDVLKELDSRWLSEAEMAACLRWWSNSFGNQGALDEQQRKYRNELLKAGKAHSEGKEVRLSSISKFIDGQMLSVRRADDPLPDDTIPPALIQSLSLYTIPDAFGWQEMPIIHWLRHLIDSPPDTERDITRTPSFAQHVLDILGTFWNIDENERVEVREILEDIACIPTTISSVPHMMRPRDAYFPEADVFQDLPVVRPELLLGFRTEQVLQYLGVQKRCELETFITKAMSGEKWTAIDLARYLITSAPEHVTRVMDMKLFPCDSGERRHVNELFASTEINKALKLPVINCDYWDSNTQEALFLIRKGLREYPTFEQLIHIASYNADSSARHAAFTFLCEPLYETVLEKQFNPSKFSDPFIPGVRDGKPCQIPHGEVFSDPNWKIFGFGHLTDRFNKKNIAKLKIRDRPTADKLFQILESTPPKDPETAKKWFGFLAEKGVFSAGEFERIADLKIVPIEASSEQPQSSKISYEAVSPRECFLKSESYMGDHFYQRLFKFVDFGRSANAFLKTCGAKERPECIDVLKVLLKCPKAFFKLAEDDHERYLMELRVIAVSYKSLPKQIREEMCNAPIFLAYKRNGLGGHSQEPDDNHKICKIEEVFLAADMENRHTFRDCVYIAPREELLEKFYSEMCALHSQCSISASRTEASTALRGSQIREHASHELHAFESDSPQDLTNELQRIAQYPVACGGFGDIWKCDLVRLGEIVQVAVKTIRASQPDDHTKMRKNRKRVRRELKVWGRLKHHSILPLWGVANNFGPYPAMICPWADNGTLTDFLESRQDMLSSQDKFSLLNDIALGLQYLHNKSIVHGDLTGSNVLIYGNGQACLADFGLSTMVLEFAGTSYLTSSIKGNIRWAAAELFEVPEDDEDDQEGEASSTLLSIECDIYSFGSIFFQILTYKVPYYNVKKDNVVLGQVMRGKKPEPPKESQIAPVHWEFIQRCWLPRASRPSVEEVVVFVAERGDLR